MAGEAFEWTAAVLNEAGRPFEASLPLRVTLYDAAGEEIESRHLAAGAEGVTQRWTVPLALPAGACRLEAVELVSGKSADASMAWEADSSSAPKVKGGGEAEEKKPLLARRANVFGPAASPPAERFGPHLRDVAVSRDGATVLVNAFNWDENLYLLDAATGEVRLRDRVGDHFAYAPEATDRGFAVQGFDLASAAGYHYYLLDDAGKAKRRFALPGLPGAATGWAFTAPVQDRVNNFTVAPEGEWLASSGNLALAVWSHEGNLLWSRDWSQEHRRPRRVAAPGNEALAVADENTLTAHRATDGEVLWKLVLPADDFRGLHVGADGITLAIRAAEAGGRAFVVRHGQLLADAPTAADDLTLSPDGASFAVTTGHQLRWYSVARGLQWIFQGDDLLHFPRIAPDGDRVAVASQLGTVCVLDANGDLLHQRDVQSIAVPAWLPQGDLLLAGWDGNRAAIGCGVSRRLADASAEARTRPASRMANAQCDLPIFESRITSWVADDTAVPNRPNLLGPNRAIVARNARRLCGAAAKRSERARRRQRRAAAEAVARVARSRHDRIGLAGRVARSRSTLSTGSCASMRSP